MGPSHWSKKTLVWSRCAAETHLCVLQRLQEEAQWLMVVEYVRALMQKRLVCRSADERRKLTQQMVRDDQLFREILHGLVSIIETRHGHAYLTFTQAIVVPRSFSLILVCVRFDVTTRVTDAM